MPISFLNPVLLWGALAAAVPLLLHFWRRRLARDVRFSDLRFLREVQARRARTAGIKRYLLLLLRMLIIVLMAGLLAGPRLSGLSSGGGRVSLLLLVDGSASMQTREGESSRFEIAIAEAAAMGGGLTPAGEVQILRVGSDAQPLFADWLPSNLLPEADLSEVRPDDTALDPVGALAAAAEWVDRARYRARDVVLIGDFQPTDPDTAALRRAVADLGRAGVRRLMLRPVGSSFVNGGVLDVDLPLRVLVPGERAVVSATVQPGHEAQEYHMELDGRRVAQAVATVPPGEAQRLLFPLVAPDPGLHTGRIMTTSDRMAVDDEVPFVLEIPERIDVLIVHGEDQDRLGRGSWRYLAGALSPDGSGLFAVRDLPVDELFDNDLYEADLVFCVDPGRFGSARLDALVQWLRWGGRCVFLAGDPRMTGYLGETLLPAIGGGRGAAFRSHGASGEQGLRLLPGGRDLLAGFPDPAIETLTDSRWRRYHVPDPGGMTVLIEFTGGEPALMEADIGAGRLMLLPFNLSSDATDLAGNPMSVPFWRRLAVHLLGGGDRTGPVLEAGDALTLRISPASADEGLDNAHSLRHAGRGRGLSNGTSTRPISLRWRGMTPVLDGGTAMHGGVYAFLSGGDTLGLRAVSSPASESPGAAGSTNRYAEQLESAGLAGITDLASIDPAGLGGLLAGRDLRILLAVVIIGLLVLETWISRRA